MRTIDQAIDVASRCLAAVGVENPQLESEFLVAAFLQMPRTWLVLNRRQALAPHQIRSLRGWLKKREQRKPLAYVSGEQPFRDLTMKVNSFVLVPRPETELLVEQALRLLDQFEKPAVVVDVGTGSGNIALSVALHRRVSLVLAIDCSARALKLARANHARVTHGAPIHWMQGNLLAPLIRGHHHPRMIIANLPYVRRSEWASLEPELRWEPKLALDGGPDGLRVIEPCIAQAATALSGGGVLLLEIGADQSPDVIRILESEKTWEKIQVFRDLAGLPRIVQAYRQGY
jgi:release factor glutamine methyltransferase